MSTNLNDFWKLVYEQSKTINYSTFTYNSVKQALIERVKANFPEMFNDFIESSELIAIIECFAYICDLLSYRIDLVGHENILSTAERMDSVLKLAQYISYTPSRPLSVEGYARIVGIKTNQVVTDTRSNVLTNKTVFWEDQDNQMWYDQFMSIFNAINTTITTSINQTAVSVIDESYSVSLSIPTINSVISATIPTSAGPLPFDVIRLKTGEVPIENPKGLDGAFTVSVRTKTFTDVQLIDGIFCYVKQGTTINIPVVFNDTNNNNDFVVEYKNIDDKSVWLTEIPPVTQSFTWDQINTIPGQNVYFTPTDNRNRYQVNTLLDNRISLAFGDGTYSNKPFGTFNLRIRTTVNESVSVERLNNPAQFSFDYIGDDGQTYTATMYINFDSRLVGLPSESIQSIKKYAPAVYTTQDRMVTQSDYGTFLYQDTNILSYTANVLQSTGRSQFAYTTTTPYNIPTHVPDCNIWIEEGVVEYLNNVSILAILINDINGRINTDVGLYHQLLKQGGGIEDVPVLLAQQASTAYATNPDVYLNYDSSGWSLSSSTNWMLRIVDTTSGKRVQYKTTNVYVDRIDYTLFGGSIPATDVFSDVVLIVNRGWLNANGEPVKLPLTCNVDRIAYDTTNSKLVLRLPNITELLPQFFGVIHDYTSGDLLPYKTDPSTVTVYANNVLFTNWTMSSNYQSLSVNAPSGAVIRVEYSPTVVGFSKQGTYYTTYQTTPNFTDAISAVGNTDDVKLFTGLPGVDVNVEYTINQSIVVNPSTTNVINMYVLTVVLYEEIKRFCKYRVGNVTYPTSVELTNKFGQLFTKKMATDEIVCTSAVLRQVIGPYGDISDQRTINVVKTRQSALTSEQIRQLVVNEVYAWFDARVPEVGAVVYISDLITHLSDLSDIAAVTFVPRVNQVRELDNWIANKNEVIYPSITVDDVRVL